MTTRTSALKRLLSGLMALCLVLSLMPMMPLELTAAAADATKTVYVGVIEYIADFVPTLHYWGPGLEGNATLKDTGETVQFSVGSSYWDNAEQNFRLYKAEIPVGATGAKTWDEGSENPKWAEEDIALSGDDLILLFEWSNTYHNQRVDYVPDEPVSVTVYCINSKKWDEVAAHAWNEGGAGTTWPGIQMSKTGESVNGFDVYEVTFDVAYEKVVFNNNGKGSQTGNLSLEAGQYYDTKSETWYASLDEVPVIDSLATNCYLAGEFNSWSTIANEFKLDAEGSDTGYISLELDANTEYEFKIVREGTWTSCATPITGTVAELTFSSSVNDNCVITTTVAGDYVFSFGVDNSMLSVTYPTCNHEEQEVIPGYDADFTTPGLTDGLKCSVCGEILVEQEEIPAYGPAKLHKASISLNGNIAINYYMLLSDKVQADESAYMQFTMADGEVITVPRSQSVAHEGYYVFTCEVAAKEMTDDVVCQFFYEGGSTEPFTYNVKAYADTILGDTSITDELRTLTEAMLNYGAASQIHFGYNTDNLANGGNKPDDTEVIKGYDAKVGQGTERATLYSASLILKSETTLRFFFRVDSSAENFTATHDGKTLEVKQRGGFYYVDVVGIAAKDLDNDVTITISDGADSANVLFNPMAYCQGVQDDNTGTYTQGMKDLVAAIYLYNKAANNYFKET